MDHLSKVYKRGVGEGDEEFVFSYDVDRLQRELQRVSTCKIVVLA